MKVKREYVQEYSEKHNTLSIEFYDIVERYEYNNDELDTKEIDKIKERLSFMI